MTYLFKLLWNRQYKYHSEKDGIFFYCKIAIRKERMVFEVKIIKQKLEFEECLKQRLEFICEFSKVTPTFINSSIRKIDLYSVENESRKNDIV